MLPVTRIVFCALVTVVAVSGTPISQTLDLLDSRRTSILNNPLHRILHRSRRSTSEHLEHHIINPKTDCMLITSDEGQFFYKAPWSEKTVCGVFFLAAPDKKIEVVFNYLDVPCDDGGLVAWVDGWELNGEVFPSERDGGPIEGRLVETCGARRPKKVFISGQNAALLQYRIPRKGKGFIVTVRHIHNNIPCNVLLYGNEGVYTIRNYGRPSNCSLTSVSPSSVDVLAMNVGVTRARSSSVEMETGTIYKCYKRGISDFVEIGGSLGLDTTNMQLVDNICGIDSSAGEVSETIACEVSTVRLVSSGQHDNSVTVSFSSLQPEQFMSATIFCGV